jgi:hypothetical protein
MQGGEIQLGWVGLEPTTNPESFRGCSTDWAIERLVRFLA